MDILIIDNNKEPIYLQIKKQIIQAVFQQELKPQDALPSIRDMAGNLDISVITVKRAYEELEGEGFIVSRIGKGSFIAEHDADWVRDQIINKFMRRLGEVIREGKWTGLSSKEIQETIDLLVGEES
ncbi:GntR family transcriptional regulator [Lentibacillus amyloliquefaciens]|uniref:HTH gntR-type domain-containing protein n=1 Tax=Lentibacillus amyloliquefaciens TaxID=1472767 RepID=A0A0U4FJG9_9BACI|nr:GntR family transcriptional regulator [Lentibacillus amyloliquefaciens]ALX48798.1 hypothetical protein AOX59_09325 [Lentibacillus amyloliquefaciens]